MALHTADGARKYLTTVERDAFLRAAELTDRQVRTLCMTLAYAGCRLSEALALTVDRVVLAAGVLVLESLETPQRHLPPHRYWNFIHRPCVGTAAAKGSFVRAHDHHFSTHGRRTTSNAQVDRCWRCSCR
jgi:hypothetical protein